MVSLKFAVAVLVMGVTQALRFNPVPICPKDAPVGTKITLDIRIVGRRKALKPVTLGLFDSVVPKTVKNFINICLNKSRAYQGHLISYNDSHFHRIIPGFMIQGGDFTKGDGTGGVGFDSRTFPDENFQVGFGTGVLAMANAGPDTNGSQFFITTTNPTWLNGHHVVFGRVLQGMSTIKKVEAVGTESGEPTRTVFIKSCTVSN